MENTMTDKSDYKVADISLADFGRKEIELAEKENKDNEDKISVEIEEK